MLYGTSWYAFLLCILFTFRNRGKSQSAWCRWLISCMLCFVKYSITSSTEQACEFSWWNYIHSGAISFNLIDVWQHPNLTWLLACSWQILSEAWAIVSFPTKSLLLWDADILHLIFWSSGFCCFDMSLYYAFWCPQTPYQSGGVGLVQRWYPLAALQEEGHSPGSTHSSCHHHHSCTHRTSTHSSRSAFLINIKYHHHLVFVSFSSALQCSVSSGCE